MQVYGRLRSAYESIRGKDKQPEQGSARLTFSITASYPEKVLKSPDQFRAIGISGKSTVYSILALPDERAVMAEAEAVKAKTIDAMSADPDFASGKLDFRASVSRASSYASTLTEGDPQKAIIPYIVGHDVGGYGPLSMLMDDTSGIEEIMVNAPTSRIVVHHSLYGYCTTNLHFNSAQDFRFTMNRILSSIDAELCEKRPIIDAHLYDGSRLHAQLSPYAVAGAAASIRLNSGKNMDLRRLIANGTVSAEAAAYLWMALLSGVNMLVAGAPASGKTTLLLALLDLMPRQERIITIEEDTNELKRYGSFANTAMLQGSSIRGRHSVKSQVINALHMRPDRLIIGELRGEEAGEAFFGANVGVPFVTTIHATSNGTQVVSRLSSKPMSVQDELISMLDLSALMERKPSGERRLSSLVEYSWLSRAEIGASAGKAVEMRSIMEGGEFDARVLKGSKVLKMYSEKYSISRSEAMEAFKKRLSFINGIGSSAASVYDYIGSYGGIA